MYSLDDSEAVFASMSSWEAAMQDDFEFETYLQGVGAPMGPLWWTNPDGS